MTKEINSPQNETFKYWKSLTKSKGLKEGKHFLLSGSKLVEETLRDPLWQSKIHGVLTSKKIGGVSQSNLVVTELASNLFEELDVLGTDSPILVLEQPNWSSWQVETLPLGLELLCPFGDPQNVGALLRTAYAFGASKVILLKEAAHPLLPKAIKASSGAVLRMPIEFGPSLHEIDSSVIALDLNGKALDSQAWPRNLRLLLGEEGRGVPSSFRGERMTLPMKNPMESLNAAVAAGIVIYQLTR